jgi:hypothetical protein
VEDMSNPEIVRVTGMVCGEFKAPGALTVMLPEYVPAPRPDVLICALTVEGAVPELAERVNQAVFALTAAVQLRAPAP